MPMREEGDVREGELARPAEQQVEPERQDGVHHQRIAEVEEVFRQHVRQHEAERQQDEEAGERSEWDLAVHLQTFLNASSPNRPCGRSTSTSMMTKNGVTDIACGE